MLAELTRRIARQEGRHIDFYAAPAERRLATDPTAQRWVRRVLERWWRPVGSGVMPHLETDFLIEHLFGGVDGARMAERIDRRIDRLPGLDGLHFIARTVDRRLEPTAAPAIAAA